MPFADIDDIESFLESDDDYDTEGWERDSGEALPRYVRSFGRATANIPRPQPPRPVGAIGGGTIKTPAGQAQFQFSKPVATKDAVEATVKELKNEIKANADAIKRIDQTLDKNTAILDKKLAALESAAKQSQQSMLLPMLLTKQPELQRVVVGPPAAGDPALPAGVPVGTTLSFSNSKFKSDDNTFLLIALMSMSGGFGSGDSSNMMLLALALGGFGNK